MATLALVYKSNAAFCESEQKWFDKGCMQSEKVMVPWKFAESYDTTTYSVSKRAFAKIKKLYYRPIFQLKRSATLKTIPNMSYFLLLRKEVHLIFESICHKPLVMREFDKLEHLLVREVYISLHDVEEIVSLKLVHLLENECIRFTQHFNGCPVKL